MKKLALLLSLLALGALVLTACEGDDDASTPDATEARLSPEQKIEQTGNNFAVTFAAGSRFARMTQPFLERITCKRIGGQIENCTPPSSRFRKSFAGATVEDIAIKGNRATTKFSNGEVVELDHVSGYELGGIWLIHKFGGNAGTAASATDPNNNSQLSNEERIEQTGNEWAALFAADRNTCRHMGQPACERMGCERVAYDPIKNCTPPSPEFRESFADATVERVVVERHHATAEFSNGESVEFDDKDSAWFITEEWVKKVARRNFEP